MTYEACTMCPRRCGVDRTHGGRGACRMTSRLVLARAALHYWEEPCISGTAGSGTVFFSGCPLGCVYCQNNAIADGSHGVPVDDGRLTEIFFELAAAGVRVTDRISFHIGSFLTPVRSKGGIKLASAASRSCV